MEGGGWRGGLSGAVTPQGMLALHSSPFSCPHCVGFRSLLCHLRGTNWRLHIFTWAQSSTSKQSQGARRPENSLSVHVSVSLSQKTNTSQSTFKRLPLGLISPHQVKGSKKNGYLAFSVSWEADQSARKEERNGENICVCI